MILHPTNQEKDLLAYISKNIHWYNSCTNFLLPAFVFGRVTFLYLHRIRYILLGQPSRKHHIGFYPVAVHLFAILQEMFFRRIGRIYYRLEYFFHNVYSAYLLVILGNYFCPTFCTEFCVRFYTHFAVIAFFLITNINT